MQRSKRLGLAPGLVLGECQQAPSPFAHRRGDGLLLCLRQHLEVMPGPEGGVESELLAIQSELVETTSLDPTGVPSIKIDERRATPEVQCLPEHIRRSFGFADGEQFAAAADPALEEQRVDIVGRDQQPIPLGQRLDGLRAQRLAEPGHTALDDFLRRGRWLVSPQRIGQPVGGTDLAGSHREGCKYHSVAWADLAGAPVDDKRTQQFDPHGTTVSRAIDTGQGH